MTDCCTLSSVPTRNTISTARTSAGINSATCCNPSSATKSVTMRSAAGSTRCERNCRDNQIRASRPVGGNLLGSCRAHNHAGHRPAALPRVSLHRAMLPDNLHRLAQHPEASPGGELVTCQRLSISRHGLSGTVRRAIITNASARFMCVAGREAGVTTTVCTRTHGMKIPACRSRRSRNCGPPKSVRSLARKAAILGALKSNQTGVR